MLAGDSVMVHLAMHRRAGLGKGKRIFTGTNAKLEKENSILSTMTSRVVTSTPLNGLDTPLNPLFSYFYFFINMHSFKVNCISGCQNCILFN